MTARPGAVRSPVLIEFGNHQVSVSGPGLEVQDATAIRFRPMLAARPGNIVGRVVVHREDPVGHRVVVDDHADSEIGTFTDLMPIVNRAVVTAFIRARPDLVWLHAGAVQMAGRALALIGPWGHGKSTIAASLLNRGWTYLSDDVAPFDPTNLAIHPFPEMPRIRSSPGRALDRESVSKLQKVDVCVGDDAIARAPAVCAGVVFPEYHGDRPDQLSPCPASLATLKVLAGCLSFAHHRETALRFAALLAQTVPALDLSFRDADIAADLLIDRFRGLRTGRSSCDQPEASDE